jgi:hypothetical protein
MGDAADHRESLARAYETLRRLEDADRRRRFEEQQRGPVERDEPMPVADWRNCPTTAAMTGRQFDQWCRDGKPPLDVELAPHFPAMTKAKVADMVRAAVAEERANMQAAWETLASIIGEETGKADAQLAEQIQQLRIELVELKAELHDPRGERSADALELPDWRHAATH